MKQTELKPCPNCGKSGRKLRNDKASDIAAHLGRNKDTVRKFQYKFRKEIS